MSFVRHATSKGEYKRGLDSKQLIIFAASFTQLLMCTLEVYLRGVNKKISVLAVDL